LHRSQWGRRTACSLKRILDATSTGHLTVLVTKTGKSYGANDFSEQFRK